MKFRNESINERQKFTRKANKKHNARNFLKEILEKTKNHGFENYYNDNINSSDGIINLSPSP